MKTKKIQYGEKFPVHFTKKELNIIRDKTFCNPDFGKVGLIEKDKIKINMSLDDIEDLQGYIAAEANHTENKKLQKELDDIFNKLQDYLDTYEEI
ncbi:MAG: hypothetical protein ABFR82_02445 [Nitrospirota bacterium]